MAWFRRDEDGAFRITWEPEELEPLSFTYQLTSEQMEAVPTFGGLFDLADPVQSHDFAAQILGDFVLLPHRGPWQVPCPQLGRGATLKLDRWGNKRQTEMMDRARRTWGDRRTGEIPMAKMRDDILPRVIASSVFLGMEGVQMADGTPMEDTMENRLFLLHHFPDLAEWIFQAAQDPVRAASVIVTNPGEALRIPPPPDPEARPAVSLARFENLDDDDLED